MKRLKISACMMVKNEEANMPQVLESLADIVDEIIVVDTGSSDRTPEIAKLYGAKVYHHPWQQNFSLHRNQSLGYATGDWCLVIDADERVVKAPAFKRENFLTWLRDEVDSPGYSAVAVMVNDYQQGRCAMSCNSARLFKKGTIKYVNTVHNQPQFQGACILNHWFTLTHLGYDLTPEMMKKKFWRTKGLLYKEMRDNPANFDVPFYFCQLYGHHGYTEKSRYWGEKYLATKDQIPPERFNTTIYFTMIKLYQEIGELEKAAELLREALADRPQDPDIAAAMSDHGAMTRNNTMMAEGARRYLAGFNAMTMNPAKRGGQFYFSMNDDIHTLNLYRLCIASLEEGMRCWNAVRPRIGGLGEDFKNELKTNINLVGLPHLLMDLPEMGEVRGQVLDIREVTI